MATRMIYINYRDGKYDSDLGYVGFDDADADAEFAGWIRDHGWVGDAIGTEKAEAMPDQQLIEWWWKLESRGEDYSKQFRTEVEGEDNNPFDTEPQLVFDDLIEALLLCSTQIGNLLAHKYCFQDSAASQPETEASIANVMEGLEDARMRAERAVEEARSAA